MNLDQMVAEAKERLHRSIGQRGRWARHDFDSAITMLRRKHWGQIVSMTGKLGVSGDIQFR